MSQTIDERIVEMRFDNKQFEQGAKETMSTLDKLKAALNMESSAKNFQIIDKAANSIDLSGIAAGIEALQNRFSTLGIVGMRVISNITDSLMNMASGAMGYVSDAIVSGGVRRAQNIENAHFQLQALLKDEKEVQAIMADAMTSVDGTAYAYDEAAKAASQFAASRMRAGEEMISALQGITGVAAMTNSEYEGISKIFTTVAGNGRLMGDQLLQLASRGLNAAATLADYFREVKGFVDVTESDIRELVSDGQISFRDFAAAMDWAFGESAFRANETFTGALSNMRSALARIGAEFFSPLIEQNSDLILLINTVRERINDIKKGLSFDEQKSAISGLVKLTGKTTESFEELFSVIKEQGHISTEQMLELGSTGINVVGTITDYINGVTNETIRASYATKTAINEITGGLEINQDKVRELVDSGMIDLSIFQSAMEKAYGDQTSLSKQFTDTVLDVTKSLSSYLKTVDVTKPLEIFHNLVYSTINVFKGLYSVLKPIKSAMVETFRFSIDDVSKLTAKIESFTSNMKLSEKGSSDLHDAFKGVADILRLFADGFINLLKAIIPVKDPISSVGSGLLSLAGAIGRSLSEFSQWVRESPIILRAYELLTNTIRTASSWLTSFIGNIGNFIEKVMSFPIVQRMIEILTNAFETMSGVLGKVEIRLAPFSDIFDIFLSVIKTAGPIASSILQGIGKAIKFVLNSVSEAIGAGGFNGFIDLLNSGLLVGIGVGLSKFVESITVTVNRAGGIFSNVNRILFALKNTLLTFQAQLKANVIKTIAVSIGILTASLFVLSLIDSEKLGASLGVVTALIGELFAVIVSLSKFMTGSRMSLVALSTGLISFSISVTILAGALKKVSDVNQDALLRSLGALTVLLIEMTTISIALSRFGGKIQTGAVGIIAFAASIYILTSSVKKLGEMDVEVLKKGLISVGALMGELAAFMLIAKFGNFKTSQAIGIVVLSSALLILYKAVEKLGMINDEVLLKGIISVGALLAEIGAFTLASGQSKHVISTAASLVIISYALQMLEAPMKEFGSMSLEEIGKGLLSIGGALAAVTIALNLMPKNSLLIGVSLLSVAKALTIIKDVVIGMSAMSWEEIGKGMVVLAGSMTILSIALNAMKGTLGGSAAMLIMATSLAIFVPILKMLGGMDWTEIAKGLISLAAGFAVIGIAGLILGPITPAIFGLASALLLLGIACSTVGVGILAVSAGLAGLAASGVAGAAALVEVIKILVIGVLKAITDSAEALGDAIKTVIISACSVIIECVPEIVKTVMVVVKEVMTSLADNAPEIVTQLLRFIIGVIDALAADLPTVIQSVVNLFMQFFSGLTDALKGIDTSLLLEGVIGIGLIGAIMLALSGMASLAPQAIIGVLAMGGVIAELAILLAAIGALAQTPGLEWLIGEGGRLLQGVGTAIGQFIGGIVGGFMSGITEQFPKIANDLSQFMENIQPFIKGAEQISPNMLDGVKSLAGVILLLTAADILDGLTSWLTGGKSLARFGEELSEFGPYFAKFAEDIKGIDPEVVEGTANAALALAELSSKLQNTGGLSGLIFGEQQTLTEFAEELIPFGEAMVNYSTIVGGNIDKEAVEASIKAAEILLGFSNNLPDMGGLKALIFGNQKSLAEYALEFVPFGASMVLYSKTVSNKIDQEAVEASIKAAEILLAFSEKMPDMGGLKAVIFGDQKTLAEFAEELIPFAEAMVSYSDIVSGLKSSVITSTANAAKALVEIQNSLGTTGGIISWFTGDNGIDEFGKNLAKFGEGLVSYYFYVKDIDVGKLSEIIDEVEKLVGLINSTLSLESSGAVEFSKTLRNIADSGIDSFIKSFEDAVPRTIAIIDSWMKEINDTLIINNEILKDTLISIGVEIPSEISYGITTTEYIAETAIKGLCSTIILETKNSLPGETFTSMGGITVKDLANGVTNNTPVAIAAVGSVCGSVKKSFEENLTRSGMVPIGENAAEGLADGINNKVGAIKSAAISAAMEAVNAAKSELRIQSPSKVFMEIGEYVSLGLARGIVKEVGSVEEASEFAAESTVDTMSRIINAITQAIDSNADFQPVITPVLDLTNVNEGASQIASMFDKFGLGSYDNAMAASSSFRINRNNRNSEAERGKKLEEEIAGYLKDQSESERVVNYNQFYIQSTDPKQAAEEIDYIMERRVERRRAVWAK